MTLKDELKDYIAVGDFMQTKRILGMIDVNDTFRDGMTPLVYLILCGQIMIKKQLIEKGACVVQQCYKVVNDPNPSVEARESPIYEITNILTPLQAAVSSIFFPTSANFELRFYNL